MKQDGFIDYGRIGGLRHIGDYLLRDCQGSELSELYKTWLSKGTKAAKEEANKAYDEWYNKTYPEPDAGGKWTAANEANDIIVTLRSAEEQDAFEHGARYGAQMILDLLRPIP